MTFQIHALDPAPFKPMFSLTDSELRQHRAMWVKADCNPGYPCRVSLNDAPIGSRLLLVNFDHHPSDSPYRASHAIYVNPEACQAHPEPGFVPESIASRLISWRAFDPKGRMIDADVIDGQQLEGNLPRILAGNNVAFVHLHNAKPGCYAARVTRKQGCTRKR